MKQLRQYIRQILLTEGAAQPVDLPDHVVIVVKQLHDLEFAVYYGDKDNPDRPAAIAKIRGAPFLGRVMIGQPGRSNGNCDNALKVNNADALDGWGPMLYDVAMEHATEVAGGLISDRHEVSGQARKVWDYYMNNRSDVTIHQLDDPKNTLTPEEEDNCNQDIAQKMGNRGSPWQDSPLSKRYTKSPATKNELENVGKLVMI